MDDFKSQINGNIRLIEVMGPFLFRDHLEELVDYLIVEPTEEDTKERKYVLPQQASQLLTLELDYLETSLFTDLARNRIVDEKDGILDWESSSQDSEASEDFTREVSMMNSADKVSTPIKVNSEFWLRLFSFFTQPNPYPPGASEAKRGSYFLNSTMAAYIKKVTIFWLNK